MVHPAIFGCTSPEFHFMISGMPDSPHTYVTVRSTSPSKVYKRMFILQTTSSLGCSFLPSEFLVSLSLACAIPFALAMDAGSALASLLSHPSPTPTSTLVKYPTYLISRQECMASSPYVFPSRLSILYSKSIRPPNTATSSCHNHLASFTG